MFYHAPKDVDLSGVVMKSGEWAVSGYQAGVTTLQCLDDPEITIDVSGDDLARAIANREVMFVGQFTDRLD